MRNLICTIILLFTLQEVSFAQSKPKRDASKDKSGIVAITKQANKASKDKSGIVAITKQANKRTIQRNRKSRPTKTRGKRKSVSVEQKATFLTVNRQAYISETLSVNGGNIYFDISTDGKEWTITDLPGWCHVTKYSNWFVIAYDGNTTHEERKSWIGVKSDEKMVRLNLSQPGSPLNVEAKFDYPYLQHNQYSGCEPCLKINTNVTISGAAGQECWVEAYILDKDGTNIKASNGYENYASLLSKDVYVKGKITPSTDNPETFNVVLCIPNKALHLVKRNNKLQCKLVVYCTGTREYVDSANYTLKFKAKNKNGRITTSYSK